MTPIGAALNRARTTLSVLVMLLLFGAYAYIDIPKEQDPDVNIPIIYVSMHHEGISPEDAERLLVRPMETELRSIEGVKEMRSTAYEGGANVLLEFDAGFDANVALDDVREKVDTAKTELPEDTDEPEVHEVNLSQFPVLVVTLSGPAPERTLLRLARDLQDAIEGIPAVLEVNIRGDREELVELVIDPMLVDSYGLQPQEIFTLVDRSNQLIAAGALDTGEGRFAIKVPGLFESVSDIMNMPIVTDGDAVVRIRDVATVRRHFKDPTSFARVDGRPSLALEVSKRSGENVIETIEAVRALVTATAVHYPPEVEVDFSQDRSSDIRTMLSDLQNNITSAILLVMIVIVAALGLRGGLLVGIAIPGSFLTGVLVLYALGFTVNIVVLFALILAVGMLVDGAIVVTEYADRKLAEGETKEAAYGLAARRMAWPITASTATTLAAFMPLLFWPGMVGEFMKYLPATLLATLSASLAMALIFVPVLGAHLRAVVALVGGVAGAGAAGFAGFALAGPAGAAPGAAAGLAGGYLAGRFLGGLLERTDANPDTARALAAAGGGDTDTKQDLARLGGPTGAYVRTLGLALRAPWVVLFLALGSLGGVIAAYGVVGQGVVFFPEVEPEQLQVKIHARGNLSVWEKDAIVRRVEEEVLTIGREADAFDSVYVTSGEFESRDDEAEDIIGRIDLELADWDQRPTAHILMRDIRARTADLAGIWVEVGYEGAGPPVGKPVNLQLSALNPALLEPATAIVREKFDAMDGLVDIEDGRPVPGIEWEIAVDRAQAAKFDADISLIGSFVQLVTKGLKISDFRPDDSDEEIDIVARYPLDARTMDQLDAIRVSTDMGLVPLSNFVIRTAQQKTGTLSRVDGRRIMYVRAEVDDGVLPDDKVRELRAWLATDPLPAGVDVTFKGEDEEQAAAQAFLMRAFAVALFLMAIILVTQFNSFYSGFLILTAVVMSTTGVLIGLMVMNEPFSVIMSGIGVIALAGIVVNNNIVLIDTYDRIRRDEPDTRLAILRTGAQRLRPVLLTTITTILGLTPMVLSTNIDFFSRAVSVGAPSTQWWVQLATAIVFGLAFATLLTLFVTPALLQLRANIAARLRAKGKPGPAADGAGTATDHAGPDTAPARLPQAAE